MKYLIICLAMFLVGCATTVPVVAKFPTAPEILMEKCPALKTIEGDNISIIEYTKTVIANYTAHYDCVAKNDAWIEWYTKQKSIFEEIK